MQEVQELTYGSLDEALADALVRLDRAQAQSNDAAALDLLVVRRLIEAVRAALSERDEAATSEHDGDTIHRAGRQLPAPTLTPREGQVLQLMAAGLRNKEIAADLGIAERTAAFHVGNVMTKFGADGRVEAITLGYRCGLLAALEPA
jgi:DNA-binding CsgD family transcriptional regulator